MTMRRRPPRSERRSVPRSERRSVPRALAVIAAATWLAAAAPASAEPGVWTKARDPKVAAGEEHVREARRAYVAHRHRMLAGAPLSPQVAAMSLRDTRVALTRAIEAGATDFGVRMFHASVLRELHEYDKALAIVKGVLADDPPAPIRADALSEIAVLYAHAGQREEEIRAYTAALELEPHGMARSQLLANRAEALMALGDVTAAVEGYRAALAPLTTIEMFWRGSTTLFSLGVALDRTGNPEAGMEAVRLARSYDPSDRAFRRGSWFFAPAHDEHWYWALGAWTCGRSSTLWAARAECYERAVAEWELYLQNAPAGDPWAPLAHVRLATVKRERDEMKRAFEAQRKSLAPAQGASVKRADGARSGSGP
jgi:tetratricopeptide (TPR) repeat protein